MSEESNPFRNLFASGEDALERARLAEKQSEEVCALLTRVFLFTGSDLASCDQKFLRTLPKFVIHLPLLAKNASTNGQDGDLTLENYSMVFNICPREEIAGLAERIMCTSELELIDTKYGQKDTNLLDKSNAIEPCGIQYLAECYSRAENEARSERRKFKDDELRAHIIKKCQEQIIDKACTIVCTDHVKALLSSDKETRPFVLLIYKSMASGSSISPNFFSDMAQHQADNLDALKTLFDRVLDHLYLSCDIVELSTVGLDTSLDMLEFFSYHTSLSKVLINFKYWLPDNVKNGRSFETQTILGKFISPSCIANNPLTPSKYFAADRTLYKAEVDQTMTSLHCQLDHITGRLLKIFDYLFRAGPEVKKALINWLVLCFESNNDRGKMASRFNQLLFSTQASDGFFMNLSWILLRLCVPFMSTESSDLRKMGRVSAIDVTYCAVQSKEMALKIDSSGAMIDFSKDSKLVSPSEDTEDSSSITPKVPFHFITHCFFLTHKCLMLGMTQIITKYQDIHRNISRLHNTLEGIDGLEIPPGSPLSSAIQHMRTLTSQLFGIRAHALNPAVMDLCLSFYSTTAQWMVQLVINDEAMAIPDKPPAAIRTVPECLVENMSNIVIVLRQMESQLTISSHQANQFISFATLYMRNATFIHNPHIRARIAQLLQFIMYNDRASNSAMDTEFQRELFASHSLASRYLLTALFSIFVDIEHTGESMEFEDKFMYRLPMYEILEFLWTIPAYRPSIELSADEVVQCETVVNVPIFLRFINMLINDAIVQLDEGLESLVTIRETEALMDSDEWNTLSNNQKKEYEEKLKEAKMYAVNRNKLSGRTVNALRFITKDTRKPFVISIMVDRVAAMLNYVLKQLVGERNSNYKVKDASKYHFDPRELVKNIISIYINLGYEKCFCEALTRDKRSFSMDLFAQAERVLRIVADRDLISDWDELSIKVKDCQDELLLREEAFEDAPDEFLDPLTQELMEDPVILPTSGHITDRATIMRHLLSDQQDPFNRAPLTADMLVPNKELQTRITKWKHEKMTS